MMHSDLKVVVPFNRSVVSSYVKSYSDNTSVIYFTIGAHSPTIK